MGAHDALRTHILIQFIIVAIARKVPLRLRQGRRLLTSPPCLLRLALLSAYE